MAIREKRGLAYQVSSFVNARKETGIYVAYMGTKPETYKEAKQVLIDEVRLLSREEPLFEEIYSLPWRKMLPFVSGCMI